MSNGPFQLIVIGFDRAALPPDVVSQIQRLRDDGVVRLVDGVFVAKNENGDLSEIRSSDIGEDAAALLGTLAGALFGSGAASAAEAKGGLGRELGMFAAEGGDLGLGREEIDVIADLIPRNSIAAFLLIEHVWAIGVKEAVSNGNGVVIAHGWLSPATLHRMGMEAVMAADIGSA